MAKYDFLNGPVLRIEIQDVKHQMMYHLQNHHKEIYKMIEEKLPLMIAKYDYDREIEYAFRSCVHDIVVNRFRHGSKVYNGIKKAVDSVVNTSLANAFSPKPKKKRKNNA